MKRGRRIKGRKAKRQWASGRRAKKINYRTGKRGGIRL